jgi:dolichol-phosphate mannosyltransferase
MAAPEPLLEVLLPVHNEGESIEATLREIHAAIFARVPARFLVCEDGSVDDTKDVLRRVARELPMRLIMSEGRKGYSRAVVDGMRALAAPWLLCLDSDGQCDPRDFDRFWAAREGADVLIGWRVHRADSRLRRGLSRGFYRLARKEVVDLLAPAMGAMEQGFWWEFSARAHRGGFRLLELEVHHRERRAGVTQVYRLQKMPGIGYRHVRALFRIRSETRRPAAGLSGR